MVFHTSSLNAWLSTTACCLVIFFSDLTTPKLSLNWPEGPNSEAAAGGLPSCYKDTIQNSSLIQRVLGDKVQIKLCLQCRQAYEENKIGF